MDSAMRLSGRDLASLRAQGPTALPGVLRDGFRLWLAGRDFALSTQATYYKQARGYLKWLVETGAHPEALTDGPDRDAAVSEYLSLAQPSTQKVAVAAIRVLYEWLDLGPVEVDSEPVVQVVPDTLSGDEQSRVLDAAAARSARDYALITFFLDVGPTSSELRRLDGDAVELSARAGSVRLTEKHGQSRVVELAKATTWVLLGWRRERRALLGAKSQERAFFVTLSSRRRIRDDESLEYIVASIGEAADLGRRLTPSALRATVEQRLLIAGVEPSVVAARMGQAYINAPRVRALMGETRRGQRGPGRVGSSSGQLSFDIGV
ncbi:tyrosine-type recombinase/integrase [Nocardia abscessus]|uniref:tyrosine-type recombinase/integrase n=1 Tax=Nocardia abscessus TaxID=120957 RepID=UPI002458B979|nr:tyrosine-type recombinase/integrase [Nocardia abscessus]